MLTALYVTVQAWERVERIRLNQIYLSAGQYLANWYDEANTYTGGTGDHPKVVHLIADVAEVAQDHNATLTHLVRTYGGLSVWYIREGQQVYEHCNAASIAAPPAPQQVSQN